MAEHLGVAAGTCLLRIRRLRAPHGVANTWVVNYLPLDVGRQFSIDDLRTASVIQCIDRVPILLVEPALQTQSGRIVDFAQFHYLGHPNRCG